MRHVSCFRRIRNSNELPVTFPKDKFSLRCNKYEFIQDAELARLKAKSLELEKMRSAEAEMEKLRGELAHLKMAATMAVPPLQCSTPVKRSQIPTKDGSKKTLEKVFPMY